MANDSEAERRTVLEAHELLAGEFGVPIRTESDSVDTLVSAILSQNTTDTTRDRAMANLRGSYADWEAVRGAHLSEIAELIRVCGLADQKAATILRALDAAADQTGGAVSLLPSSTSKPPGTRVTKTVGSGKSPSTRIFPPQI